DMLDYSAAARDFERATELDAALARAWAGRAWALAARVASASPAALACAERAMKLDAKAPETWIARSFTIRPDDAGGAISAARKAVALAPGDARTHAALGDAIGSPGDWPA